ncbi:phosphoribosylglycinamide formyltransferase [Bacillota bacterium LX-D]|nr:phosphoribosylglycinamide formyltransferase [Bacillota bacterium LX-D]
MLKVGILVSGRGSNMVALLEAAKKREIDAEIALVLSDNQTAPALKKAQKYGVKAEYVSPENYASREEYDLALVEKLKAYGVELVVLAGYMRLVTPQFLAAFPNKVVNIHPALLPAFPGLHVQAKAVEYGVKYSGCTVHFVDAGMDSGPIIAQAVVPVEDDDNEDTLAERILQEEHRLFPQVVGLIAQGKVTIVGRKVKIIS